MLLETRHPPSVPLWRLPVAVGGGAALAAIVLAGASPKIMLAGLLALALVGVLPIALGGRHGERLLVIALALSIPLSPNINFLLFPDHVGGAASVQVQVAGLVVLLFIAIAVGRILTGRSPGWTTDWRIATALAAYIGIAAMSLINAFHPVFTVLELLRLAQLFVTFVIVSSLRERRSIDLFIGALAAGAIAQGAIALVQYATGRELGLHFFGEGALVEQNIGYVAQRATGTIGHPNQLAYYFEILIPVFFAMVFAHSSAVMRALCLLALLASIGGIMTTLSRAAWLSVPLSLGLVFATVVGTRIMSRRGSLVLVAACAALFIGLMAAWPTIERRFTADDHQSSASRAPLNRGALSVVEQYPMLGVGLNNFSQVFHRLDRTGNARIFRTGIPGKSTYYKQVVHNMYLLVWAEVGTIGLLAFIGQFVVVFCTLWRRPSGEDPQWRALAIGIAAGLAAQLFHGMFDPGFKTTFTVSLLVYTLLGVLAATNQGIRPAALQASR